MAVRAAAQPDQGSIDATAEELVRARVESLENLEQREWKGEKLSDDERDELIFLRSWRMKNLCWAIVQENNPEKVEITYSSDEDRALTEAGMRVVREREPRAETRPAAPVVARKPVRSVPRAREQHPASRRRSSSSTTSSSDDPDDPEPGEAGPSRCRGTARRLTHTLDSRYCVESVAIA
jgi:hypothetical protein